MKKIIIIGATSGIGRGLAEIYSQEDFLIGITGRRENLLKEVCARDEDKLFYQVCDITDTQSTISSLETLVQKMGGMDILIICAGTGELNPELSYQLEEPTLLTNVIGFTNIADWGFRYFKRQKKRASGYYLLRWRYSGQWYCPCLQCIESLSNQLYGRATAESDQISPSYLYDRYSSRICRHCHGKRRRIVLGYSC